MYYNNWSLSRGCGGVFLCYTFSAMKTALYAAYVAIWLACLAVVSAPGSEAQQPSNAVTQTATNDCQAALAKAEASRPPAKGQAAQCQTPSGDTGIQWSNWALVFIAVVTASVIG